MLEAWCAYAFGALTQRREIRTVPRREVAFGRRRDSILAASQAADRALVCRRHGDRHFAAPPALRAALTASVEAAVSLEAARVMSVSR
jgi:hypothetical protein